MPDEIVLANTQPETEWILGGALQKGPDIAIEVRSPDNHAGYLRHKRDVYFATGTYVVIDINPAKRTVVVHDADGAHRMFAGDDDAIVSRYPGLRFPLGALFADLHVPE